MRKARNRIFFPIEQGWAHHILRYILRVDLFAAGFCKEGFLRTQPCLFIYYYATRYSMQSLKYLLSDLYRKSLPSSSLDTE